MWFNKQFTPQILRYAPDDAKLMYLPATILPRLLHIWYLSLEPEAGRFFRITSRNGARLDLSRDGSS
jgi:hypothetical protein